MVGYYMLGGFYLILMGLNVWMDLFYGNWLLCCKVIIDSLIVLFLIFYLGVMFYGVLGLMVYLLGYWGIVLFEFFVGLIIGVEEIGWMEWFLIVWCLYVWLVKVVMIFGLFLMLF